MTNAIRAHDAPTIDITKAVEAAAALGKDGVEVLERLHAIQKEERDAGARRSLARAIAKAKAEFPEIKKTYAGPHTSRVGTITKGNYAPLEEIARAIDPVLARHGLSYHWDREATDGKDYIVCIVSHEDGAEMRARFPALVDEGRGRTALQSIASGESYGKRYSLIAALGLTTCDPDDDAQSSEQEAAASPPVTEQQYVKMRELIESIGDVDEPAFLKHFGAESVEAFPSARYASAMVLLAKRARGK